MATASERNNLGRIIKQQRIIMSLTLGELSRRSSVSPAHLVRIEKGERFPSARTLLRIAKPLGFDERELFTQAGYLSPSSSSVAKEKVDYTIPRLDPEVAGLLGEEPLEVQRTVINILTTLKSIAKAMAKENQKCQYG